MQLILFSGGAAKAVVTGLQTDFEAAHGCTIDTTFDAVGAMRDKLLAGAPCDVLVLSASLIDQLTRQGHVVPGSARTLGQVATGVAVAKGASAVPIDTSEALRKTLLGASGLYVPDLGKSSAGIHIAGMLKALGIDELLADRIHEFPNGAVAMGELARHGAEGAIGCTQVTEIMYTPGVQLLGELPAEHALSTVYTAAVCVRSGAPAVAQTLVDLLASDASAALRELSGFRE